MLGNRKSQHSFAQIPDIKIARSSFDRSFTVKDTIDFDYLTPFYVEEIIPGDTHNVTVNAFARLATQLVPIMDNMYIDFFFFFVPNRLTYDKWEKLCGAQDNPGDSTDYIAPALTPGAAFSVGDIFDKMGLPTGVANVKVNNTMPLRSYIKIWNDWFRDQNLQDSVTLPVDQGPDVQADFFLMKRGKRHDYFTSCLPDLQKGDPVQMPLGTWAPITGIGKVNGVFGDGPVSNVREAPDTPNGTGNLVSYTLASIVDNASANQRFVVAGDNATTGYPQIFANLTDATSATINEWRQAMMMQSLLELDMRGGTRYVEILRAHYNVVSPDFRLQRAEFLGGGSTKINSHPVPQMSPTSGSNYFAQLGAYATASVTSKQGIGFTKSFVEHGYVLGVMCPRADLTYQQGTNRMWLKSTRYDFFWTKFQELGEQAVEAQEIYAMGTTDDLDVFGYQERYAEYRYKPSEIHGEFRSTYSTPLDQWHMAQEFSSQPLLNDDFIVQATPIERALANSAAPHLLMDMFIQIKSARPMLTYSVPASIGRF